MEQCNIIFDPSDKDLVNALMRVVAMDAAISKNNNKVSSNSFQRFNNNNGNKLVRSYATSADSEDAAIKLNNDLIEKIKELFPRNLGPGMLNEYIDQIQNALGINDATQKEISSDTTVGQTKIEVFDKNKQDLDKHLTEFYGLGAYGIISQIRENFSDMMTAIAYFDIETCELRLQTTDGLNENIREVKQMYYQTILNFLKNIYPDNTELQNMSDQLYDNDGNLNFNNHYNVTSLFYNYLTKLKNYQEQLQTIFADSGLSGESNSLLEAARAYTILQYFDNLIMDTFGEHISYLPGTKNREILNPNKYFYSLGTSHQRKSWQTSEQVSAEKSIAKLTEALLRIIPLKHYRTGNDMHKRIDSTSLIESAHTVFEFLLNEKPSKYTAEEKFKELQEDILTLYDDPINKIQRILEILFEKNNKGNFLAQALVSSDPRMDYMLSVLKSTYEIVFDKSSLKSIYSKNKTKQLADQTLTQNILEEIASLISRNTTVTYLEIKRDFETGAVKVIPKKRYFDSIQTYKLQRRINSHINGMESSRREDLEGSYKINDKEPFYKHVKEKYLYQIALSSGEILQMYHYTEEGIFNSVDSENNKVGFEKDTTSLLSRLDEIDINKFCDKIKNIKSKNDLSGDNLILYNVLQFIEDATGITLVSNPEIGLETLAIYKNSYSGYAEQIGMSNFLQPLLRIAFRNMYINHQYVEANKVDKSLTAYLTDKKDPLFRTYKNDNKKTVFKRAFNQVNYEAASRRDEALSLFGNCLTVVYGESIKSTTKDRKGNAVANNSVIQLAGMTKYYLHRQQRREKSQVKNLLFAKNIRNIQGVFQDLDIVSPNGDSKSIKEVSLKELTHHTIFTKFWGSYLGSNKILCQPTTYADKSTPRSFLVDTKFQEDGDEVDYVSLSTDELIKRHVSTIGKTYKNIYNSTIDKLKRITAEAVEQYNKNNQEKIEYNAKNWHDIFENLTEQELVKAAVSIGEDVELDKDYKVVNGKLSINPLLEYNTILFNDINMLTRKFEVEKTKMIGMMLQANFTINVLDYRDDLKQFTGRKLPDKFYTKTDVFNVILNACEKGIISDRKTYFTNWVDETSGNLILAKQNNNNIVELGSTFDPNASVELNPLLDKFFYVDSLIGNNLRYSLTGFEINHPVKFNDEFTTLKDALKVPKVDTVANKFGLEFDTNVINDIHDQLFNEQTGYLSNINSINDLIKSYQMMLANKNVANVILEEDPVFILMDTILEKVMNFETNAAQGIQFKRNNIVLATLQTVTQNLQNGVPRKVKCAVIEDVKAPVFDYRSTHHKKIKPNDGSAGITPFQSILENRSLGSQAVGFIKKPIWHNYDEANGTAFLAKFATFTYTNEVMRASLMSDASGHRIFKKCTNLQWNGRKIDLTKKASQLNPLTGDPLKLDPRTTVNYRVWFQTAILGRQKLFYKDKYNSVRQINYLSKSVLEDGTKLYYTQESNQLGTDVTDVYHLFYDQKITDTNGNIIENKSVHIKINGLDAALAKYNELKANKENNVHTINSLYELHSALGSIYSCNSDGSYNEYNNEVVVNFMTNNCYRKEGVDSLASINEDTYDFPLKEQHIGYTLNHTSVKEGTKNINPASSWQNDEPLTYFEVDSAGLGMQLNADSDVTEHELTEFSQVISATAAYGYTFTENNEILVGLAKSSFEASRPILEAVEKLTGQVDPANRDAFISELYDAVGRIILSNDSIKNDASLTHIIKQGVDKIFDKYSDHNQDKLKIPFSDPQIYSDFVATLASTITTKSIKRKHPGGGMVMAPSYGLIQYYDIPTTATTSEKLMAEDIVNRAMGKYKEDLRSYITTNDLISQDDAKNINTYTIKQLEQIILSHEGHSLQNASAYYIDSSDIIEIKKHVIETYLKKKYESEKVKLEQPIDYFIPTDIVDIYNAEGEFVETVDLSDMGDYYRFKDTYSTDEYKGYTFKTNISRPRNLKPSLIRWQYDDENGQRKFKNFFDLDFVRDAYKDKEDVNDPAYRKKVQQALHAIHSGKIFNMTILPKTLENQPAEMIVSNPYKEIFGLGDESLATILKQGKKYFEDRITELYTPQTKAYDMAFLKENGDHTLISFKPIRPSSAISYSRFKSVRTDNTGRIFYTEEGENKFQIGQWVNTDKVRVENGKFIDITTGETLKSRNYRIKDDKVQEKVSLVKPFDSYSQKTINGDNVSYGVQKLYEIASTKKIQEALGLTEEAALQFKAKLVHDIYDSGDYIMPQVRFDTFNGAIDVNRQTDIQNVLSLIAKKDTISEELRKVILKQKDLVKNNNLTGEDAIEEFKNLKTKYQEVLAKQRWVCFQDSAKWIASRIPSQTLQSFMAMKCVGWTENSKNMIYVSHIQTFLQGSDFDIDKAYIMGQNYDSNGIYVGWSNLFDYTSLRTLEASKRLPIPKGIEAVQVPNNNKNAALLTADIDALLENVSNEELRDNGVISTKKLFEDSRVNFLQQVRTILLKLEATNGEFIYEGKHSPAEIQAVKNMLNKHSMYKPSALLAEKAYKNVASANIYNLSHDIRNRDQAYTPVGADTFKGAAAVSPKAKQTTTLNMLNPLTKLMMQIQNLMGKDVIGISANGDKFWFNAYHWWTKVLKTASDEDLRHLRFSQTFTRIQNRSRIQDDGKIAFDGEPTEITVNHLPDLDILDSNLVQKLKNEFNLQDDQLVYHYIDQKLSELITCATDNAKELVLAKINAGTSYANMYIYLITMGFNVNDIVAFMTSPVAEFIDTHATPNFFNEQEANNKAYSAIKLALGEINPNDFIYGTVTYEGDELEEGGSYNRLSAAKRVVINLLGNKNNVELFAQIKRKLQKGDEPIDLNKFSLQQIMQAVIQEVAQSANKPEDIKFSEIFSGVNDKMVRNYINHCGSICKQLCNVSKQYTNGFADIKADAEEFLKVYNLAQEISRCTTAFLSLNQGIPTSKLDQIKLINKMNGVFSKREKEFSITSETFQNDNDKDIEKQGLVIEKIIANNPELEVIAQENGVSTENYIRSCINTAMEYNIVGNFDITEALKDQNYWNAAKEYLNCIKGTINILDMIDHLPQYRSIMDCFRSVIVADGTLSVKSRVINELTKDMGYLDDKQIAGIFNYIDQLSILEFVKTLPILKVKEGSVDGFNMLFDSIKVDSFDLKTIEGIMSFKNYVETTFLTMLQEQHSDNPLIKHLERVIVDGKSALATDIDLLAPEQTAQTRMAYDEILRGMAKLSLARYDENYSLADILQLYNLIVNFNRYGGDKLTTTFKDTIKTDSLLYKYFQNLGTIDFDVDQLLETKHKDLQLNAAPIINAYQERTAKSKYVKVIDPIWGYILKKRADDGTYNEETLFGMLSDSSASLEVLEQRKSNFFANSPFIMPEQFTDLRIVRALEFDAKDLNDSKIAKNIENYLYSVLSNLTKTGRLTVVKIC